MKDSRRILAVNFKAYQSAFGAKAVEIARSASRITGIYNGVRIILAVPSLVYGKVASVYEDVFLQHVDVSGYGAYTGFLPVEALRDEGVRGTLINHSEHKVRFRDLESIIPRAGELGLEVLACADTPREASAVALLSPAMIAVEPPELIGTGIPVSKAKPEVITGGVRAVRRIADIPVLAGAGITSEEDVVRSVELGSAGVLVASAIMKSKDPGKVMESMAHALETAPTQAI